ncbi:MAG: extracellular solute-binding protein [Clostridiales bacterium]|nr:extracellular solute-binding protein [Clostridiales bacterium]
MKKWRASALASAILLLLFVFAGCSQNTGGGAAAQGASSLNGTAEAGGSSAAVSGLSGDIMIAAASSLQDVFEQDLIPMFNKQYPNIKVSGAYGSSDELQTQIENGLDAQIFFSASAKQMDALVSESLIDRASVVNLLQNKSDVYSVALCTNLDELQDPTQAFFSFLLSPAAKDAFVKYGFTPL